MSITQEYLKKRLYYNPETGEFIWRERKAVNGGVAHLKIWNIRYAGKEAGAIFVNPKNTTGYRNIGIDYKSYPAHRLAYLYMVGEFPTHLIDHIDRNGLNNKWDNLRPATPSQNCANFIPPKNNTSGYKGVSFVKASGKYHAYVTVNRKRKNLGLHTTAKEAAIVVNKANREIFGEFARINAIS